MKTLERVTAFVVTVLLVGTALDKIVHWPLFIAVLEGSPLALKGFAAPVAGAVIMAECLVALSVAVRQTRRDGFLLGGLLFALFTGVILVLVFVRPGTACGCTFVFGTGRADPLHAAMNGILTFLCLFLRHTMPEQPSERTAGDAPGRSTSLTQVHS
jgi:hypothetical protein